MRVIISLASVAALVSAQPTADTIVYVTQESNGPTGGIYSYTGGSSATAIATGCAGSFRDVLSQGNTLYVSSANQIYKTAVNAVSTPCGTALISGASATLDIAHIAIDSTFVYFTDRSTGNILRVPQNNGPNTPTVFLTDGTDGVTGVRLGVFVYGNNLVYTTRGVDASNASIPMNAVFNTSLTQGTPSNRLFRYASNQRWWLSDVLVSTTRNIFLGAELRNDSRTNNIQRSAFPLQGLNPIQTGISNADEDNTYVTLDEGALMCWYTNAHTNELNALNATARFVPPVFVPFFNAPTSQGAVHGVTFIVGSSTRFNYCSSPVNACPSATASPSAGAASATAGGNSPTASPTRSAATATAWSVSAAALAAAALVLAARG